jgi:uncharacterized heparinase superfamily protein
MLQGMPIIGGPANVDVAREERSGATVLRAAHDGYAESFGVLHQRTLLLANDGQRLDGEDLFTPTGAQSLPADRDAFALRFHLHPSVKASRLTDSHGAMLMLPNKEVWTFSAYEDRIDLEESVYLAGNDGPRRTVQLVVYGRARKLARVQWAFTHSSPGIPVRRLRSDEPQLPL